MASAFASLLLRLVPQVQSWTFIVGANPIKTKCVFCNPVREGLPRIKGYPELTAL